MRPEDNLAHIQNFSLALVLCLEACKDITLAPVPLSGTSLRTFHSKASKIRLHSHVGPGCSAMEGARTKRLVVSILSAELPKLMGRV